MNRLIEHQRTDGSTLRYTWDSYGRLVASVDPLERLTRIGRDAQGNITSIEPPGAASRNQYDNIGRITESQDPAGAITRYGYDEHKRLIELTLPDGGIERYHYPDPAEQPLICDNPIRIEDPRGGEKHLSYTEAGQLASYTDCSGKTTRWSHDRWGQLTQTIDPEGHATGYTWDKAGRISAIRLPNGQTRHYQHDRQGKLIRIEADLEHPVDIGRDLWGRIIRITQGGLYHPQPTLSGQMPLIEYGHHIQHQLDHRPWAV